jgi:hypothetical protein
MPVQYGACAYRFVGENTDGGIPPKDDVPAVDSVILLMYRLASVGAASLLYIETGWFVKACSCC